MWCDVWSEGVVTVRQVHRIGVTGQEVHAVLDSARRQKKDPVEAHALLVAAAMASQEWIGCRVARGDRKKIIKECEKLAKRVASDLARAGDIRLRS